MRMLIAFFMAAFCLSLIGAELWLAFHKLAGWWDYVGVISNAICSIYWLRVLIGKEAA